MANPEHAAILQLGAEIWRDWRQKNAHIQPDLSGVNLSEAFLMGADLTNADLSEADLSKADLSGANLQDANLSGADLSVADLTGADLRGAQLGEARLIWADLSRADLEGADLTAAQCIGAQLVAANLRGARLFAANLSKAQLIAADLSGAVLHGANLGESHLIKTNLTGASLLDANLALASLVESNLEGANLSGCRVFGVSVWNTTGAIALQDNLVITSRGNPFTVIVDRLAAAQFIHLMLHSRSIQRVVDSVKTRYVLILGRFDEERTAMLDVIRDALRRHDFAPLMISRDEKADGDIAEAIVALAGMCRFVLADLTDSTGVAEQVNAAKSRIAPVPVRVIYTPSTAHTDAASQYDWARDARPYRDTTELIALLTEVTSATADPDDERQ